MRSTILFCSAVLLASACATPPNAHVRERVAGAGESIGGAVANGGERVAGAVDRGRGVIADVAEDFERPEDGLVADPFEGFNRSIYAFNDGLDHVVLGPVSSGYRVVVPAFGRDRIRDFIDNLKTPVWFANEVLQGDLDGAGTQAARFSLNSTIGFLGFYDFAANQQGLEKEVEDFGQTLAVWGVDNGPYIMLPVLGPTTMRDATGRLVDIAFNPLTWAEFDGDDTFRVTRGAVDFVDIRERTDEVLELIRDGVDPYAQGRAIYVQSRNERIREVDEGSYDSLPEFEDLPDFE